MSTPQFTTMDSSAETAIFPAATPHTPRSPGHKRSATAIIKSIVSPGKSAHKKSSSVSTTTENPLNTYMNRPPVLPPLDTSMSFLPPLDLDPPVAPFAMEDRQKRMHKKSLSSISLSSFKLKKDKDSDYVTTPSTPTRGSLDISGTLRDLIAPNRGEPGSPRVKTPSKSKSAIDFKLLRRQDKQKIEIETQFKQDKENRCPRGLVGNSGLYSSPGSPDPVTNTCMGVPFSSLPANEFTQCPRPPPHSTPTSQRSSIDLGRSQRTSRDSARNIKKAEAKELVKRYTPTEYNPSSQRNFNVEPSLAKPWDNQDSSKKRPKSEYLPVAKPFGSGLSSPRKSFEERKSQEIPRATQQARLSQDNKPSPTGSQASAKSNTSAGLDLAGIDTAFEALLDSRGVPDNMRDRMRGLDIRVKQEFIHKERQMEKTVEKTSVFSSGLGIFGKRPKTAGAEDSKGRPKSRGDGKGAQDQGSPSKKARPRSRTFGNSKDKESTAATTTGNGPASPKKHKSTEQGGLDRNFKGRIVFPPTTASAIATSGPPSPTMVPTLTPEQWINWLKEAARRRNFGTRMFLEEANGEIPEEGMKDVEIAVLHKLRLVLRNEPLRWVEGFLKLGGLGEVWAVIERVLGVEWREEHEDLILHELLLCMKALCTASLALKKLAEMETIVFPRLLDLLFDEERKGPSEFTTRGLVISLLYSHLSGAPSSQRPLRTRRVLGYLADKQPKQRGPDFIEVAHTNRPYRRWCKEVVNVTKEVFWIFLHGSNIVPLLPPISSSVSYSERNFPTERPPVPAAPYVGGVEWDATTYLAAHLDLLNACIASLATREERNDLRMDLRNSGWERVMGAALRTCKEKLHTAVHECLKTWVRAAAEDEWYVGDVRFGPRLQPIAPSSPKKGKKKGDEPPRLELGIGLGLEVGGFGGGMAMSPGMGSPAIRNEASSSAQSTPALGQGDWDY